MDEYTNPGEKFELMYGDELKLLQQTEEVDLAHAAGLSTGRSQRKRGVDDLFGDINNILLEEEGNKPKKHKSESQKLAENFKTVSSIDYIYPFISVTRHDGERIYVRKHSEAYELEEIKRFMQNYSYTVLTEQQSKDLWDKANEILNKKMNKENNEGNVLEMEVEERI